MRALTLLLTVLVFAGCSLTSTGEGERESEPAPAEPAPSEEAPAEPSFPRASGISVPDGFRAEIYARGLTQPTALAFGPDGLLYATQNDGRVVRVRPRDRRPRTYADGFEVPLGLTWHRGSLYVSDQGTLYQDGEPVVTGSRSSSTSRTTSSRGLTGVSTSAPARPATPARRRTRGARRSSRWSPTAPTCASSPPGSATRTGSCGARERSMRR